MEEKYIIHGPEPVVDLTDDSLGKQLYESLLLHKQLPIALTDAITGESLSYETIFEKSCRLAESLRKYGITQNDVIGIFSENNLDYFYPVIAAMYLGIVVTTFNPYYTSREILHAANISKPIILFCSETTLNTVLEVKQQLKFIQNIVIMDTNVKHDFENLEEFISNNSDKYFGVMDFKPIKVKTDEQVAFILYSSGTTGLPKGVMLTHKNINATIALSKDQRFIKKFEPGSETALGLLPFYHAFGLCVVFRCLIFGRKVVILTTFDPKIFLKTIQDYRITNLFIQRFKQIGTVRSL